MFLITCKCNAYYGLYKATRKKMPPDLAQHMPYLRKFCRALRIPVLEISGQEADDIIAELETTRVPERAGRAMDHEAEDAFERLRAAGYM